MTDQVPHQTAERPAIDAAAERVAAARRVWLGTHREPDGDAIGSLLGLGWLLRERGQQVTTACQDPVPPELAFLPGAADVVASGPAGHDLAIALDAGDLGRLGALVDEATWRAQPTVVLDHHASNTGFGDVDVVDPTVASTAELVLRLADRLDLACPPAAATCLLTGIVTDTIGFRTPNSSAATLAAARRLVEAGAGLAEITDAVFYQRPLAALRLTGRALERLEVRGRVGLAALDRSDFDELGASSLDARGLSSTLITAQELAAVVVAHVREDGAVDVSMRSKPGVDLVPVARALGGGGHPQASGARLELDLNAAVARVWAELGRQLATVIGAEAK